MEPNREREKNRSEGKYANEQNQRAKANNFKSECCPDIWEMPVAAGCWKSSITELMYLKLSPCVLSAFYYCDKHHHHQQLGEERVYCGLLIPAHSLSLWEARAGAEGRNLQTQKQRLWRSAATRLPAMVDHSNWAVLSFPHQSLIQENAPHTDLWLSFFFFSLVSKSKQWCYLLYTSFWHSIFEVLPSLLSLTYWKYLLNNNYSVFCGHT